MGLQATNAGIDFQQRVSAYMMILMEFDMDISLALQLDRNDKIEGLNFEACESIDDLIITLSSGKKVYFQMKRTISLSESKVYTWLAANAHNYGFILRYPQGKQEITGTSYEPWHYRYVGVDAAREIYERGICLEEYFEQ